MKSKMKTISLKVLLGGERQDSKNPYRSCLLAGENLADNRMMISLIDFPAWQSGFYTKLDYSKKELEDVRDALTDYINSL